MQDIKCVLKEGMAHISRELNMSKQQIHSTYSGMLAQNTIGMYTCIFLVGCHVLE